jgi:phosphosulfolactate synthase (CoM biosynthesis protein A)
MKNHYRFWIVFSLIIVLAIGVTGGILFERHVLDKKPKKYTKSSRRVHFPTLETMAQELNLTFEQQEKIREIFKNNEESFKKLRSQIHERLSSMRTQLKDEIKSVLNEEQNRKFETMIEKYIAERKKEMKKRKKYSPNDRTHRGEEK